jgi:hypothetical protein
MAKIPTSWLRLASASLVLAPLFTAQAVDYTWTGGTSGDVSNAANWSALPPGTIGAGDRIVLNSGTPNQLNTGGSINVNGGQINVTAGAWGSPAVNVPVTIQGVGPGAGAIEKGGNEAFFVNQLLLLTWPASR